MKSRSRDGLAAKGLFTTRDKELHVYNGTRELYFLFKVMNNEMSVRFSVCLLVQTKFGSLPLCNKKILIMAFSIYHTSARLLASSEVISQVLFTSTFL